HRLRDRRARPAIFPGGGAAGEQEQSKREPSRHEARPGVGVTRRQDTMRLYVNIDHVATLREARKTDEPDPVQAAAAAERAGADGITVHLREDRRHIQDADVDALARSVRTVLNLELGAHAEIVRLATRIKPAPFQATLVPEKRQEITTEGGLALRKGDRRL